MRLTFARSARRHGVSEERAAYVVQHCGMPLYPPDDSPHRVVAMFLGLDQHGIALEVAAVETGPDELIVIHAMRLREKFRADLLCVMAAHDR